MSHEIRTPLNSIVGFSALLCEENEETTTEDRIEYGKLILSNSDQLLTLINDILDISRLETGKVAVRFEQIDIVSLCKRAIQSISTIGKKNIEYSFTPCVDEFYIDASYGRLTQVIANLLNNSSKFTTEGFVKLDFSIDTETDSVLFSITDTGCGIPKEKREVIFERFEKINEHAQGTGLGLAISKQLVLIFGGKIWVDPDYDTGCKILFTHPIHHTSTS